MCMNLSDVAAVLFLTHRTALGSQALLQELTIKKLKKIKKKS